VFLPAVIAWQLFEEVRDKLQAKYHELQVNSQVRRANTGFIGVAEGPCWTLFRSLLGHVRGEQRLLHCELHQQPDSKGLPFSKTLHDQCWVKIHQSD
jgi:hypothetical protein